MAGTMMSISMVAPCTQMLRTAVSLMAANDKLASFPNRYAITT